MLISENTRPCTFDPKWRGLKNFNSPFTTFNGFQVFPTIVATSSWNGVPNLFVSFSWISETNYRNESWNCILSILRFRLHFPILIFSRQRRVLDHYPHFCRPQSFSVWHELFEFNFKVMISRSHYYVWHQIRKPIQVGKWKCSCCYALLDDQNKKRLCRL